MRLTRFTDYSLRVLIYLGLDRGHLVTIRSISDAYGISRNHLMKVVSLLTRMGYLEAQRGPGGGIRLAHAPEDINLADVLGNTEDDLNMVECFHEPEKCVISPACRLHGAIGEAVTAFMDVMRQYTLADQIEPTDELKDLLNIDREVA